MSICWSLVAVLEWVLAREWLIRRADVSGPQRLLPSAGLEPATPGLGELMCDLQCSAERKHQCALDPVLTDLRGCWLSLVGVDQQQQFADFLRTSCGLAEINFVEASSRLR